MRWFCSFHVWGEYTFHILVFSVRCRQLSRRKGGARLPWQPSWLWGGCSAPTILLLWHLHSNWWEWCFNTEKKIDLKNTCSTVFTQNSHKAWFLANPKAKGEVLGTTLVALTLFGKVQIPTYSPCISKWFSLAAVVVKLLNIFSTSFDFSWLGKINVLLKQVSFT